MIQLTPEGRQRAAFAGLLFALFLIEAQRIQATGDPSALSILAPVIALVATGHVGFDALLKHTVITVMLFLVATQLASVAAGRGIIAYPLGTALLMSIFGLAAFFMTILALTSAGLRRFWPGSDRWTK